MWPSLIAPVMIFIRSLVIEKEMGKKSARAFFRHPFHSIGASTRIHPLGARRRRLTRRPFLFAPHLQRSEQTVWSSSVASACRVYERRVWLSGGRFHRRDAKSAYKASKPSKGISCGGSRSVNTKQVWNRTKDRPSERAHMDTMG